MSQFIYIYTINLSKGFDEMEANFKIYSRMFIKNTLVACITENSISTCVIGNSSHRLPQNIS